ncbi:hypothetical protein F5B20DRAFT_584191 [Whalleya microplaca]|nr:hypothetical protein F5B20DRAFT_584191 [Whalleya microplaca]
MPLSKGWHYTLKRRAPAPIESNDDVAPAPEPATRKRGRKDDGLTDKEKRALKKKRRTEWRTDATDAEKNESLRVALGRTGKQKYSWLDQRKPTPQETTALNKIRLLQKRTGTGDLLLAEREELEAQAQEEAKRRADEAGLDDEDEEQSSTGRQAKRAKPNPVVIDLTGDEPVVQPRPAPVLADLMAGAGDISRYDTEVPTRGKRQRKSQMRARGHERPEQPSSLALAEELQAELDAEFGALPPVPELEPQAKSLESQSEPKVQDDDDPLMGLSQEEFDRKFQEMMDDPEVEFEPEFESEADAQLELQRQKEWEEWNNFKLSPEQQTQIGVASTSKADSKPEPELEISEEQLMKEWDELESEPEPEPKAKGKGKAKAKREPKPKAPRKPRAKAEPKPKAERKPRAKPKPKAKAAPKPEPEPEPEISEEQLMKEWDELESEPEPEPEIDEAQLMKEWDEIASEPEPVPELEVDEAESEAESEPKTQPGTAMASPEDQFEKNFQEPVDAESEISEEE